MWSPDAYALWGKSVGGAWSPDAYSPPAICCAKSRTAYASWSPKGARFTQRDTQWQWPGTATSTIWRFGEVHVASMAPSPGEACEPLECGVWENRWSVMALSVAEVLACGSTDLRPRGKPHGCKLSSKPLGRLPRVIELRHPLLPLGDLFPLASTLGSLNRPPNYRHAKNLI